MSTTRRTATAALAALLLGAAVVACSSDGSADTEPPTELGPATAETVAGRTFVGTQVTEGGAPRPLVRGTQVEVGFDVAPGTIGWRAGCNWYGAPGTVADGHLDLDDEITSTLMGCLPELVAQDEWLTDFLKGDPALGLDGDTLELTGGETIVTLVDEASITVDDELVGPTWTLDTIVDGVTASSAPAGVTATLVLDPEGRATATGTCNGYSARFVVDGSTITFVPGPTTLIGCLSPEDQVEAAVSTTLTGDVTWTIDGDRLTLEGAGGRALVYRSTG